MSAGRPRWGTLAGPVGADRKPAEVGKGPVTLLVAPPLTQFNPASHGVMWVALALGLVVAVIVLVDVLGWLLGRLSRRRGDCRETDDGGDWHVQPPETELRRRHFAGHPKIGRDRPPNEPTTHDQ